MHCMHDCSLKTVVLTMWGNAAEAAGREIEELVQQAPVVAITACRVSSYNGVSGTLLGSCHARCMLRRSSSWQHPNFRCFAFELCCLWPVPPTFCYCFPCPWCSEQPAAQRCSDQPGRA